MDPQSRSLTLDPRIYRPCPVPSGLWCIQWPPPAPTPDREEMLRLWMGLEAWKRARDLTARRFHVWVDPRLDSPFMQTMTDSVRLALPRSMTPSAAAEPVVFPDAPLLPGPLFRGKRIHLAVPVAPGDLRWDSISLTASDLFLGSALTRRGYRVGFSHPSIPGGMARDISHRADLLGISLCEDLMPAVSTWLSAGAEHLPPWIAVGGPMVTLSPLVAAAHLSHAHLWIRGEGENVFPRVLDAMTRGDWSGLEDEQGVLLLRPGLLMAWNYSGVNRPDLSAEKEFDFSFVPSGSWAGGIELNLSRGCSRSCLFCSRVQGSRLRSLPVESVSRLLQRMSSAMDEAPGEVIPSRILSINDDDILQDTEYALRVLERIHQSGFRLWGIQTSLSSVLDGGDLHWEAINLLTRHEWYARDPLVWFGSDAFLPERGKRLGKSVPDAELMERLFRFLDSRGIRHHHYWICSDSASSWSEVAEELLRVCRWWERFPGFHVLAHSPFVIPYPSTPLFNRLSRSSDRSRIRFRGCLSANTACLNYPLVERVETQWEMLNLMLLGRRCGLQAPLLDCLRQRDALAALQTAHCFLRQEQLRLGAADLNHRGRDLEEARQKLETGLEEFMNLKKTPTVRGNPR